MAEKNKDPKERGRRFSISLPLKAEAFYALDGRLNRDASTSRTMVQYLIDRANNRDNLEGLRCAVLFDAQKTRRSPQQTVKDTLLEDPAWKDRKDDDGKPLDMDAFSEAICRMIGIEV